MTETRLAKSTQNTHEFEARPRWSRIPRQLYADPSFRIWANTPQQPEAISFPTNCMRSWCSSSRGEHLARFKTDHDFYCRSLLPIVDLVDWRLIYKLFGESLHAVISFRFYTRKIQCILIKCASGAQSHRVRIKETTRVH